MLPTYQQARSAIGRLDALDGCHPGLAFFKAVDVWSDDFMPPKGETKQGFLDRIRTLNKRLCDGRGTELLEVARDRRKGLLASLAAQGWEVRRTDPPLRTRWRLVTGLGISHPFETGFVFHHTLGVPYVPGSSVKGAALDWAEIKTSGLSDEQIVQVFGSHSAAGQVVFMDAFPTTWPKLDVDIVNPHYKEYYDGSSPPADWLSPTPIHFLAIAPDQPFEFIVAARARDARGDSAMLADLALKAIKAAAADGGIGGKSAVGYGYFM